MAIRLCSLFVLIFLQQSSGQFGDETCPEAMAVSAAPAHPLSAPHTLLNKTSYADIQVRWSRWSRSGVQHERPSPTPTTATLYGAVGNALLAGADLAPIGLAGKALKAAKFSREAVEASRRMNKARAYEWKKVRERLGKAEYLERGQHGHHWAIPQNQWGKGVPDRIKNHPLNIKPMPDPETHWRIDHRVGDLPRFKPAMRYWHGTPAWGKAAHVDAAGHVVSRTKHHYDRQTQGSKK
ncbi:hypothetical protein [Phenylobacterium immobile]|uniref:hypothetical protein n=1 Tax=Phenylobacterium immobile TaxID=21 RepID=UPI000B187975|nr:hypothetical protein [Phenylobacterium immobile]